MATRRKVAEEIASTEASFLRSLQLLDRKFLQPLEANSKSERPFISQDEVRSLFSCLRSVITCSNLFLEALQAKGVGGTWSDDMLIGDVFLQFADYFKVSLPYVENYTNAMEVSTRLTAQAGEFAQFVKRAEKSDSLHGLSMHSLLVMPVQRIPRYCLLLKELVKCTQPTHADYVRCTQALEQVTTIAQQVNSRIAHADAIARVVSIQMRLVDAPQCIVTPSRHLQHTCTCKDLQDDAKLTTALLFNDCILTCRPKKKGLFGSGGEEMLVWKVFLLLSDLESMSIREATNLHLETRTMRLTLKFERAEEVGVWLGAIKENAEACIAAKRAMEDNRRRVSAARTDSMRSEIEKRYSGGAASVPAPSHTNGLSSEAGSAGGGGGGTGERRRWSATVARRQHSSGMGGGADDVGASIQEEGAACGGGGGGHDDDGVAVSAETHDQAQSQPQQQAKQQQHLNVVQRSSMDEKPPAMPASVQAWEEEKQRRRSAKADAFKESIEQRYSRLRVTPEKRVTG